MIGFSSQNDNNLFGVQNSSNTTTQPVIISSPITRCHYKSAHNHLIAEIKAAIKKLKNNKVAGTDNTWIIQNRHYNTYLRPS